MRYLFYLLVFFSIVSTANAQIGLATKAFRELEAGNLGDAKIKIDLALENELAQKHNRAWYYYGRIYEEAFIKNKNVEFIEESMKGYINSINLVREKDIWADCAERLHSTGDMSRKEGVARFKKQEFDKAEEFFLASMVVASAEHRVDSLNYLNLAVTNDKLQQYDRAVAYLDTCIQMDYQTYQCAILTLKIFRKQGDQNAIDKKIAEYRNKYPANSDLLLVDVNNQLQNGKSKDAIAAVSKSINKYPKNIEYYIIRGDVYLQLKDRANAEKDYLKAIEVDPNSFTANFETGKYFATSNLKKAIPYYEKAYEINPKKDDIGNVLLAAYKADGNNYKYQTLKAKMK